MTDYQHILYSTQDMVCTVTLNRPERRNAISRLMLEELADALKRADRDPGIRCIVLTGAGKGFCAGLDLKASMTKGGASEWGDGLTSYTSDTRELPTSILFELDTPILAALNGAVAGYGFDLALGCDMRVGSDSTRLLPVFAKRGAIPESGGTWYLPRLVGWSRATEIAFLGRELSAEESLRLGLLSLVVPDGELMTTVQAMAAEIAANAPLAVRAIKRLFRHGLTEDFASHTHHMVMQSERLMQTRDFHEGIVAFVEGRPPNFEGR
ncbi:MAG: enoyl-CoA hydratase [Acidimicrobiales bacterium mtb01]|nr:enoyl-CoA hydratase/isomerase family protein [Actinomycetota bacterium]TEX45682.1 MAG: enoyl-CoA hydratase [Acidimicrobiales bacterium mtb01]